MKTWLYHKDEKAKIFDTKTDDMAALHEAGWRESPDEANLVEPEKDATKDETPKTTKKA